MTAPPGEQPEDVAAHLATLREQERQKLAAVPAELVAIAVEIMEDDAHEHCGEDGCAGNTQPYHQSQARAILAEVLPAHEATVRRELHFPTIAPMHSGEWGVHCFACSEAAGDYVPRCLHDRDDWPPTLVLRDAPPSTLVDALADKRQAEHTRGDT